MLLPSDPGARTQGGQLDIHEHDGQVALDTSPERRDEAAGAFTAYALDVLEVRGDRVAAVMAFIDGSRFSAFGLPPAVR